MSGIRSSVCGFGVNDANYTVSYRVNGKNVCCPFYRRWQAMINRCYRSAFHSVQPSYRDCTVCDEWRSFMAFKTWMECQDWEGKQLDKDILSKDIKIYSPETCAFINQDTNVFINSNESTRGDRPIGVSYHRKTKLFIARCGNPLTNEREFLGYFKDPEEAHLVWKKRKHEIACALADTEVDERISSALRHMYLG